MTVDSRDKRASAANLPWGPLYSEPVSSTVGTSERMMAAGVYVLPAWVSGTSNDGAGWTDKANAHDGNVATFAYETDKSGQTKVEIAFTAVRTDRLRIYAHDVDIAAGTHDASGVWVEIYYNGAWQDAAGPYTFAEDTWVELVYTYPRLVTVARVWSTDTEETLYLGEIQLQDLDNFITAAVHPKAGSGLVSTPLIKGGKVR